MLKLTFSNRLYLLYNKQCMKKQILLLISALMGTGAFSQNLHWAKGMGSSGDDFGLSVATDAAGNVYTTGIFENTADFDPGPGTFNLTANAIYDTYVSKLDANGNFVWAVSFGGANLDYGYGIDVDASGNVLVTGSFMNTVDFDPGPGTYNLSSAGSADCYILCLDASGNFSWVKRIGGTGNDQGYDLFLDAQGNIHTTGIFDATVDFDPGAGTYNMTSPSWNTFVSKLDNNGNFLWAANIGGPGIENPSCIAVDPGGNVYTSGYFMGPAADFDPGPATYTMMANSMSSNGFISKLDASGSFVWARAYQGSGACQVTGVMPNAAGDLVLGGSYRGTMDFDPGAGTAMSVSLNNTYDGFVAKMDASGNSLWTRFFGGSLGDDVVYDALADASGNIHATGRFSGLGDFDPGPAVVNLAPNGNEDVFILELDGTGNFVNAYGAGGAGYDSGSELDMDAAGNIYLAGGFSDAVNFNASSTLIAVASYDALVLKFRSCTSLILSQPVAITVQTGVSTQFVVSSAGLNSTFQWEADTGQGFAAISNGLLYAGAATATLIVNTPGLSQDSSAFRCIVTDGSCQLTSAAAVLSVQEDTGIDEFQAAGQAAVYPNPAVNQVMISVPLGRSGPSYAISDATGRLVLTGKINGSSGTIAIGHLPPGLYLLHVDGSSPVKLIKE